MKRLAGKVALVTGGGQGVGRGIALALAAEGARVAVSGRTLSKVEDACREIQSRGGEALAIECNVKSEDSLKRCVDAVVAHFGGLQILVNNAQEVPNGKLHQVTDDAFTAGWESGPQATFRLMKLCYPYLKGDGNIINLASAAGRRWDSTGYGCYGATKEAIRQLTRAAACEWAEDGIRTNAILPLAESEGLKGWAAARPEEAKAYFNTIPMRRVGECEGDIGRFVVTLCTDDCRYVNGQSIALDGGQAFLG
ncbi:MAG TPA: SDR family oxidoreductase [Thauera sp.]|jgi:meso-butanediol dehydrogenase/(S,S)-butanediol dehydrogenase/diacetyl reductase|nr:SDR family oxidoreductase [Thauera sp.]HRA80389.1 SDR family oxidoreductase [Thauera sp.]